MPDLTATLEAIKQAARAYGVQLTYTDGWSIECLWDAGSYQLASGSDLAAVLAEALQYAPLVAPD